MGERKMEYIYERKINYYETDKMGVVHHSNYIRWFEEARSYILEENRFGYKKMEELGIISPVLSVNARYKSMTHYYDTVIINVKVVKYNGVKITLEYSVVDEKTGEVRCTGESEHCFLDASGSPVSLKRSLPELNVIFIEMSENE